MRDPSFPIKDSYTFLLFLIFLHWFSKCTLAKILFEGPEQFLFFYNCSFSYVTISAWAKAWLYSCHCPMFNREWCFSSIAPRRGLLLITELFFGFDCGKVAFHPTKKEKLVSASVDGLMCIFDTKGDINDDEGMESVSNHHIIRWWLLRVCVEASCFTNSWGPLWKCSQCALHAGV